MRAWVHIAGFMSNAEPRALAVLSARYPARRSGEAGQTNLCGKVKALEGGVNVSRVGLGVAKQQAATFAQQVQSASFQRWIVTHP